MTTQRSSNGMPPGAGHGAAQAPDLGGLRGLPAGAVTIWAPAHESNFGAAQSLPYSGAPRRQLAICYHTPEEQPDDVETTPDWFRRPEANASTGYYADSDGDLWQMVRDHDFAWAQGTRTSVRPNTRLPRPAWWRDEYVSYNTCMLSIEIEGYAREIADTFVPGSRQFEAVAAWAAFQCAKHEIPVDREHHLGHAELCTTKSDPGPGFPWDELLAAIAERLAAVSVEARLAAVEHELAALREHTHGVPLPA